MGLGFIGANAFHTPAPFLDICFLIVWLSGA